MLPTHDVPCPRCGKGLYSSTSLEDGVNAATPETPRIESDNEGFYMRCPHCGQRIAMQRITAGSAEAWKPR